MINITDLKQEQQLPPLLRLGFRPLFLLGGTFSLFAVGVWILTLNSLISFSPLNGAFWWHSHEMLFGFVPAIIAGFLLTAVQAWTGVAGIKGKKLFALVLLWLMARMLVFINPAIPVSVIMAIDLAFLPLTGILLALPLIKIRQYRNMIFLPVLTLMTLANFFTYLPQLGFAPEFNIQGTRAMVILISLLVAILGGRVIPMFTANGTKTEKVLPIKWLEISSLFSLFTVFIFIIADLTQFSLLLGIICLISAALHLYRNLRWRPQVTVYVPLVWVLHACMMFIPIGLTLIGIHFVFNVIALSAALHCLTIGVIGGMIIAMMSRVSLGHTGRPLQVGMLMTLAFYAILLSAVVRSILVAIMPQYSTQLWLVSGLLWCFTYASFIVIYLPILSSPRIDGRPG